MEAVVVIIGFFVACIVFLEMANWLLKIPRIIRYLHVIAFLQKRIAEKNEAITPEQSKWVDDQLKR